MDDSKGWGLDLGDRTWRRLNIGLVRYIEKKTGSRDTARDLAQNTWVAAARFRGESSLNHFLHAVARRQVAEWFRKRGRGSRALADPLCVETSLTSRLVQAQEVATLRAWLDELPEPFQATTQLWLTGMRSAEIADALGCSQHTVRSRVSRGRQMLRARQARSAEL